ncbi:MAG: 2-amino-4-hydroxy-6-hydroxymethyldihydropteridine diphosphokinase [Pseudomonadota bacterium]
MVLIGLGSNLASACMTQLQLVEAAVARLEQLCAPNPLMVSSLYRTAPIDCAPDTEDFVNAAAAFAPLPGMTPLGLLDALKALEAEFGRQANPVRNAPRELDLDLLLFGDREMRTPRLTLPHPRAVQRRFVLAPAAEILPSLPWPGTGNSIGQLLVELDDQERVERLDVA